MRSAGCLVNEAQTQSLDLFSVIYAWNNHSPLDDISMQE